MKAEPSATWAQLLCPCCCQLCCVWSRGDHSPFRTRLQVLSLSFTAKAPQYPRNSIIQTVSLFSHLATRRRKRFIYCHWNLIHLWEAVDQLQLETSAFVKGTNRIIDLRYMFWWWRKPTQTQGDHANSTQAAIKRRTFKLWGNGANHWASKISPWTGLSMCW